MALKDKIISVSKLTVVHNKYPDREIILVSGCFDILHVGHLRFLQEAKEKADILVVGVLSDNFVKKRKGNKRPVFPENERVELIAGLEVVDYVYLFSFEKSELLIKNLRPDYYGVGGDRNHRKLPEIELLNKYNVEIKIFSKFEGCSSSKTLEKI